MPIAITASGISSGFTVGGAITAVGEVFTSVLGILTGNPIFIILIGASLIPVGFKIFKAARQATGGK